MHRVICIASIHFAQKLALVIIAENISIAEAEKIVNLRFLFQPLRKGVKKRPYRYSNFKYIKIGTLVHRCRVIYKNNYEKDIK